jgi:hypothetical protein
MLKWSRGNAKLDALEKVVGGQVWTFSILSGWTCPMANECMSRVVNDTGKMSILDGPATKFRCFSASQEVLFPATYKARKYNLDLLKTCGNNAFKMTDMILDSLPKKAACVRIHIGGDMFTLNYFQAWCDVAALNKSIIFYAYTKSLGMWVKLASRKAIPDNFILTASRGGREDDIIHKYNLREAIVVNTEAEADALGYPIDHDDSHAALPEWQDVSFALLIHGIQPAGSEASKAVRALNGVGSYSKNKGTN